MAYYPGATTGGGAPGSEFYPMSLMDYTPPEAMEGVGLEFQPWLQPKICRTVCGTIKLQRWMNGLPLLEIGTGL